jgi:hypothetical protein
VGHPVAEGAGIAKKQDAVLLAGFTNGIR